MNNDDPGNETGRFLAAFGQRNPGKPLYGQAVASVVADVLPLLREQPAMVTARLLERLAEPDRIVSFRVCWEDDRGAVQINRGYRVQHCNAVGPYKGGLRFHPDVTLDALQALAFEQTFKNSLTGLPMGGAKGGADFDPRGRSDSEIMRFCQSFMTELQRHIGPEIDIPAGDIGVGPREIGFLFGQYKRIHGDFTGALTGKGLPWGGSHIRAEATGYGVVYFLAHVLANDGLRLDGMRTCVSGAGNVAIYAAEKLCAENARVLTLSDSHGVLLAPDGLTAAQIEAIKIARLQQHRPLAECAATLGLAYTAGSKAWSVACDIAIPCATQRELNAADASQLARNGCRYLVEGANLPVDSEARALLRGTGMVFVPGKAANAGGVAVSGLEMTQNRMALPWERQDIDTRLREIMARIFHQCVEAGARGGGIDYEYGANRAALRRLAAAVMAFGIQ